MIRLHWVAGPPRLKADFITIIYNYNYICRNIFQILTIAGRKSVLRQPLIGVTMAGAQPLNLIHFGRDDELLGSKRERNEDSDKKTKKKSKKSFTPVRHLSAGLIASLSGWRQDGPGSRRSPRLQSEEGDEHAVVE